MNSLEPTILRVTVAAIGLCCASLAIGNESVDTESYFHEEIEPILDIYCFGCHGNGSQEGGLSLETVTANWGQPQQRETWWAVLKNVRSGVMPPPGEDRLLPEDLEILTAWIKTKGFQVDPANPDPGHVAPRRLNRAEYRNTIHDLMGIDFNAEIVFPPDDTGFGFDNIGDAQSLSPLLLEKYLQSAKEIVAEAVPTVTKIMPRQRISGRQFRSEDGDVRGNRMQYDEPAVVEKTVRVEHAGQYELQLKIRPDGSFEFNPGRYEIAFFVDGEELLRNEYGWQDDNQSTRLDFDRTWESGEHTLAFELTTLTDSPTDKSDDEGDRDDGTHVSFNIEEVNIAGPEDREKWIHPKNYERFFPRDEPPLERTEQRQYAQEVLAAFARRAFRRPADEATLEKLVVIAEATYSLPNKTFEAGIAQAMTAMLASPRFLFRLEEPAPQDRSPFPHIDEYSLASRLSYLFWSTMPDDELLDLATRGELRSRLHDQVKRMLADERAEDFVENFVGQWLRARDVEHVSIDPIVALGFGEEYEELRATFRRRFRRRRSDDENDNGGVSDEEFARVRERYRELRDLRDVFDSEARRAMRRETQMHFSHIMRKDRSVLELLDSNYTFLNEKLAELYEISGVEGERMRRVELPADSPRGGVLTQGTMLTVTSNPTRTSPVKRGLFVLENILGTPAPPAPPDVPELEESADRFEDREPTLREVLAAHRESALCSSCHARMDPLGLALENFNALGQWRDKEHEQPIDAAGELITGETFDDVRELKRILTTSRRLDFYRCMTQKLMTYALGRGLDYRDEYVLDEIVARVDADSGQFSTMLFEILDSPQFQRQRREDLATPPSPPAAHLSQSSGG